MSKAKSFKLRRGRWVDNYQVREYLGIGWEGEVYRVREGLSDGLRSLKLFDPRIFRSKEMCTFCQKFEKFSPVEGIVKYYHAGKWKEHDCYYMVMEYVEGRVLSDLVKTRPFRMFKSLKVTRNIIHIIDQCHRMKLSLGDIHSGNIIIDDDGHLKIIDLDFRASFSPHKVQDDVVSACKLFYELTHRSEDYSSDLRSAIPLKEDAIRKKYKSASDVLKAIDDLLGVKERNAL